MHIGIFGTGLTDSSEKSLKKTLEENNIPSSIELSFSRNPKLTSYNLEFPHSLDQKNNPKLDELKLIFAE